MIKPGLMPLQTPLNLSMIFDTARIGKKDGYQRFFGVIKNFIMERSSIWK
jgi:hypothetical protein